MAERSDISLNTHLECSKLKCQSMQEHRLTLAQMKEVGKAMSENTETHPDNIRAQEDFVLEYLAMLKVVDAVIWGRNLMPELQFPASWLDAFKIKFCPKWVLRISPAKVKTLNLKELWPQVSKNSKIDAREFFQTKKSMTIIEGGFTVPPFENLYHHEEFEKFYD